jgi:hypothetical protein
LPVERIGISWMRDYVFMIAIIEVKFNLFEKINLVTCLDSRLFKQQLRYHLETIFNLNIPISTSRVMPSRNSSNEFVIESGGY